jgi:3-phosphoshikimate 1-carboxyvinyltransferase
LLTGNERMQQRPVKALIDALNQIGAGITYADKEGFPPIIIEGQRINASSLEIDPGISSQFTSALLMITPCLKEGLKIKFKDKVVSRSYIEMTLKIMEHFGITYQSGENSILVPQQKYKPKDIKINLDWSAASYFYEIIALSGPGTELFLKGLKKEGLQGDEIVSEIFNSFGVSTFIENEGIRIKKDKQSVSNYSFDFTNYPDIAQTVIVCCSALGIKGLFSGLQSLAIKETDRINALKNELAKLGCKIKIVDKGTIELSDFIKSGQEKVIINTYNDHRMAMAFAPLSLKVSNIVIENPEVVKKSYPAFLKNLSNIGFYFSGH